MENQVNETNINMEFTKEKLSLIKRFIYEIVLVVLCLSVAFLFKLYINLDFEFKDYLKTGNIEMREVIRENTRAINNISK